MCSSPRHLRKQDLQELDSPTCSSPIISVPHRTSSLDTESELMTLDELRRPLGNISLELSDEHGNKVDLGCHVNHPTESTKMNWDHFSPHQITANITLRLDVECPIDRSNYERLWRLIAYYSDVPAHLQREIMLSKSPHVSYRYRQDVDRDALYYTGVKVNIVAEPAWLMQPSLDLQLNRPQSTSKRVRLVLSTHMTQMIEAEEVRQQRRKWVVIESRNDTRISQAAVAGSPIKMHCNVHSSGNPSIKWMLPSGSRIEAPYQSSDKRITVSPSGLLDIRTVDHSDAGVYYCIGSVIDDFSILPFRLSVEESSSPLPGGEGVSEPVAGIAGRPVSLPCLASGSPDPEINWILPDSSVINTMSNSSKIFVASNGSLTIRHSQLSDNGYYKCVAGNQHGADTMATKVTLTRLSGGLSMRKYSSRPQPAEGVSTKIKAPMENDVEASGDDENGKPEAKPPPGQADTPTKRRIPNGHPSRKPWRRPAVSRRRMMSPGTDKSSTVETRRRINMSNSQIDPNHWAKILAKVRGSGSSPKTTTPSSVQTSTNILPEPDTANTKKAGSPDRIEGSSADGTTTRSPTQEAYTVTVSGTPVQTTDIPLDIRPLGSPDQTHINYQIVAPGINSDPDLFTSSTYVLQTTVGPQPTHHLVTGSDLAKQFELSTARSTTSYGTLFLETQSHTTVGSKVRETIQRSEGNDDGDVGNGASVSQNFRNVVEVYQGESDHSAVLTTAAAFEEQSTEKDADARSFAETATTAARQATQNLQRHTTQEKHDILQIPLLTTAAPTNKAPSENNRGKHTISVNVVPPSRTRTSSNSRRKNGGKRKKPNRNRTRSKSSKSSARVTNVTPQPTTLASVSELTKTTASSQSEIETSAGATGIGAKVDTTVPFTDSQATSLSKMTHEKNTDPLYKGKNTLRKSLRKKVSVAKETPSPFAKPPNMPMSATTTSLGLIGHQETEINSETFSTLSPPNHNALSMAADSERFTSIRPPAVKSFEEAQKESTAGDHDTADTSPESPHMPPEVIPGAGSDKVENQYKPSQAENVPPSTTLGKDFTLRPFYSSTPGSPHEITKSHDSEIPSVSAKANLYEGTHESPQVTTERPATSQRAPRSGLNTTAKLNSALADGDHVKESTALPRKPSPADENVLLSEDASQTNAILTSSTTTTSPSLPPPLVKPSSATTSSLPTTAATIRASEVHPHVVFPNRPASEGKILAPESTNHIPDRHKERIATIELKDIGKPAVNLVRDRTRPVSHSIGKSSEDTQPETVTGILLSTKDPKAQNTVKQASTATPELPLASHPRLTIPGRPDSQSRDASTAHHAASGGVEQTMVVPARRGQPKITSSDIKTVLAQAESDAYLPCVAIGEPNPFLSWTKVSTGMQSFTYLTGCNIAFPFNVFRVLLEMKGLSNHLFVCLCRYTVGANIYIFKLNV